MILATTDVLQGAVVESYLGVVTAEVVYGGNAIRDFFAGLRDFFGGRTASYENVFERGQQDAIAELQQRAGQLGANAVIGIRVNTDTIKLDETGVMILITATGTALRIQGQ